MPIKEIIKKINGCNATKEDIVLFQNYINDLLKGQRRMALMKWVHEKKIQTKYIVVYVDNVMITDWHTNVINNGREAKYYQVSLEVRRQFVASLKANNFPYLDTHHDDAWHFDVYIILLEIPIEKNIYDVEDDIRKRYNELSSLYPIIFAPPFTPSTMCLFKSNDNEMKYCSVPFTNLKQSESCENTSDSFLKK